MNQTIWYFPWQWNSLQTSLQTNLPDTGPHNVPCMMHKLCMRPSRAMSACQARSSPTCVITHPFCLSLEILCGNEENKPQRALNQAVLHALCGAHLSRRHRSLSSVLVSSRVAGAPADSTIFVDFSCLALDFKGPAQTADLHRSTSLIFCLDVGVKRPACEIPPQLWSHHIGHI